MHLVHPVISFLGDKTLFCIRRMHAYLIYIYIGNREQSIYLALGSVWCRLMMFPGSKLKGDEIRSPPIQWLMRVQKVDRSTTLSESLSMPNHRTSHSHTHTHHHHLRLGAAHQCRGFISMPSMWIDVLPCRFYSGIIYVWCAHRIDALRRSSQTSTGENRKDGLGFFFVWMCSKYKWFLEFGFFLYWISFRVRFNKRKSCVFRWFNCKYLYVM